MNKQQPNSDDNAASIDAKLSLVTDEAPSDTSKSDSAFSNTNGDEPAWFTNFSRVYQQLSTENLSLLADVYHPNIVFIDPMHQLNGFNELDRYFRALYQNLTSCEFEFEQTLVQADQATVFWTMHYQHPKLKAGAMISVQGCSHIKGTGSEVTYHRDYVDLGAMLYEHVPVLGSAVRWLKSRANS